jgi:hypothetical protein
MTIVGQSLFISTSRALAPSRGALLRGLAILAVAVAVTGAHDAAAKDEFREPVWTWRLAGGNGNWGNQGDFDSPEALIEGFNCVECVFACRRISDCQWAVNPVDHLRRINVDLHDRVHANIRGRHLINHASIGAGLHEPGPRGHQQCAGASALSRGRGPVAPPARTDDLRACWWSIHGQLPSVVRQGRSGPAMSAVSGRAQSNTSSRGVWQSRRCVGWRESAV